VRRDSGETAARPAGPPAGLAGRSADSDEFSRLAYPFRRELLAHCYRMLGSVHDAEDLVQETYLRAWRYYDGFEGRSSLRTWLYRIATSTCLTALEHRNRRPLPAGLGAPSRDPAGPLGEPGAEDWLEPLPDRLLRGDHPDPAAVVALRGSLRLAFIAALQHLPPRQRAALILRDVLEWPAAEVAGLLGTSTAAVNSALQRARAQMAQLAPVEEELAEPAEAESRALLDRYVTAFENADLDALLQLLREDSVLEMPPYHSWYAEREAIVAFLGAQCLDRPGKSRTVRTAANGQPALAVYMRAAEGVFRAQGLQVLTPSRAGISHIVAFLDPGVFRIFDLPPVLDSSVGVADRG